MSVAPVNLNTIEVAYIENGCCLSAEFDTTYPAQLNGIMTPEEFEQSIKNINKAIPATLAMIVILIVIVVFIIGGVILCIVGGSVNRGSSTTAVPPLIIVGIFMIGFGLIFCCGGCFFIPIRRNTRMLKAVALESMKYSMRSTTPCSFRLSSYMVGTGGGRGRGGSKTMYRLHIDIGNSVRQPAGYGANAPYQYNQRPHQSRPFYPQQNNMPPQPTPFYPQLNNIPAAVPYADGSTTRFCSRCGTPRYNLSEKFCPSCGQSFDV